ncbi:PilZ domain-containing protein [bacterium]|nr:PilZ domain-containing protein [bacterium]
MTGADSSLAYFLAKHGEIYGPVDISDILGRIKDGRISSREWIFLPDPGEWYPVVEVPQLAAGFYSVVEKPSAPPSGLLPSLSGPATYAHVGSEKVHFGGQVVEKRRWIRLPQALTLRFSLDTAGVDTAQKTFETMTVDLSEGGLGFRWPEEIPSGTFMKLELDIFPNLLRTKGRVARSRPYEDGEFQIGVLFVTLSAGDHQNLKKFIASAASLG